jgi:pimeloyl-ACP methyl ester carboxylesterase
MVVEMTKRTGVLFTSSRCREVIRYGDVQIDLIHEGDGPLIVMLPSRGRDSEDFNEVAAGLADAGFRVSRPQPRGALLSMGPSTGIRMQDLARDVAHVIEREGAGRAVIAGHAFGNWVARMVATDHPHLVRGVVLMAAAAKTYPPELHAEVQAAGNLGLGAEQRLAALRKGFFLRPEDATAWLSGWSAGAMAVQGVAVAATKQDEYWKAGDAPLLDLVPEQDPFRPRNAWFEARDAFGERATVRTIPDASHALLPEQPRAVIAEIVAWVRSLPA